MLGEPLQYDRGEANLRAESKRPIGLRVRYLMAIDLASILLAIASSFVFRYEALWNVWPYLRAHWLLFIVVPLIRLPVYYGFRLYRRLWRYASMNDLKAILMAGFLASALFYGFNFFISPFLHILYCPSRSIVVLEGVLSLGFLAGTRFLLRLLQERATLQGAARPKTWIQSPPRVLIAGAGYVGAMILREVQRNPGLEMQVVGFVDDDREKLHMQIHGLPVLGAREDISALVMKHHIDEIIVAMPTAPGKEIRAIRAICEQAGVRTKVLPGMY